MKYILLITILFFQVGTYAVENVELDNALNAGGIEVMNSFGSGGNTNTTSLGGGNTNTTSLGGSNTNTTSLGGGNTNTTQLGGGTQTAQPANRSGSVRVPEIGKPSLTIAGFIGWIIAIMNYLVWAMIIAALLVFLYGIFMLMFVGGGNEESRSKGRRFMLWGIVSLFVMVSVWGLVNILRTSIFGGGTLIGPQFITN